MCNQDMTTVHNVLQRIVRWAEGDAAVGALPPPTQAAAAVLPRTVTFAVPSPNPNPPGPKKPTPHSEVLIAAPPPANVVRDWGKRVPKNEFWE
jgi:hypothetical protein